MENLAGRVAVVTGGGERDRRGDRARVRRAGNARGARRHRDRAAERLARELSAAGTPAFAVRTDVTVPGDLDALADAAFARFGAPTCCSNNAGVAQGGAVHGVHRRRLGLADRREPLRCRERMPAAFVPRWIQLGERAHVVNTRLGGAASSRAPCSGMYSTTKFAVVAYSESLAQELAAHEIASRSCARAGPTRTSATPRAIAPPRSAPHPTGSTSSRRAWPRAWTRSTSAASAARACAKNAL